MTNGKQKILQPFGDLLMSLLREVVITSVLDEDPPCVGVGGLCKIPPVSLAKWIKFIGLKI